MKHQRPTLRFLLLASLLVVTGCLWGQESSNWQLTEEDGLPSMTVYNLLQDSKGFIWFGTESGLCRYNGSDFNYYRQKNPTAIAVSGLKEDAQGRIWFQNFSGHIFYLDIAKSPDMLEVPSPGFNNFSEFYADSKGGLWVSHMVNDDFKHLPPGKSQWKPVLIPDLTARQAGILHDEIAINTNHGIYKKATGSEVFKPVQLANPELLPLLNDPESRMIVGKSSLIYYNRKLNIYALGMGDSLFQINGLPSGIDPVFAYMNPKGIHYLCSSKGMFKLERNKKGSFNLHRQFLPTTYCTSMMEDNENNLWVATIANGVFIIPNQEVTKVSLITTAIAGTRVNCITSAGNNLFLGQNNGIITQVNPKDFSSVVYETPNNQIIEAIYLNPQKGVMLVKDAAFKINQTKPYDANFYGSPKGFSQWRNLLLVSTGTHGAILNLTNATPERFFTEPFIKLRNERSRAAHIDSVSKQLILAYSDGLFTCDLDGSNTREILTIEKENPHVFGSDIKQNKDGLLWVATLGSGLYGFQNEKQVFHFTEQDGLLSNYILDIEFEKRGIWLGTDKGLQFFSPSDTTYENVTIADGLPSNEITDLLIENDRIYLAGVYGLCYFPIGINTFNHTQPPIYINSIKIHERDTQLLGKYELNHKQNDLVIDFIGLAYKSRGNFKYRYRTRRLDSNWHTIGSSNHSVRLSALAPGNYTFEVEAVNEDQVSSLQPARVHFEIIAPFWQRWWFITLVVLAIVALTSLFFTYRIRILRRQSLHTEEKNRIALEKSKLEQELRSSQLSALKAQLNPHFIFNALNSIQEFILLNKGNQANKYLGKFADLMRLTLDMSNKPTVTLEDEIKSLTLYLELELLRFEDTFAYYFEIDEKLIPHQIRIPAMLLQPYIENAIKHGLLHRKNNRKLWIRLQLDEEQKILNCEIEDNGIGRKAATIIKNKRRQLHKSFATDANQTRLELLNAERDNAIGVSIFDLTDENQQPSGTLVKLEIPY